MGKKGGKAPKAPDPKETAAAQTQMNIDTALAQGAINRVNQVGPDGSLTYTQTGTQMVNGRAIPIYTATTTLSPEQQRIKAQSDAAALNLQGAANTMSGQLDTSQFKVDDAVEAKLFDLGSKRLTPRLDEARRRAETDAANRGLRLGSDAYDRLMRQVGENENDAYNQLALTGREQAYNEAVKERTLPIELINAMRSGSPISQPTFVNTPQSSVANTDYAGLVNQNYQNQLAAYNAKQQQQAGMLGGLFGVAGNAALAFSDERLKEDIEKVGETADDLGIYAFRYKGDDALRIGLMAQEVEKKNPDAVVRHGSGYRMVDYRKALRLGERARAAA